MHEYCSVEAHYVANTCPYLCLVCGAGAVAEGSDWLDTAVPIIQKRIAQYVIVPLVRYSTASFSVDLPLGPDCTGALPSDYCTVYVLVCVLVQIRRRNTLLSARARRRP